MSNDDIKKAMFNLKDILPSAAVIVRDESDTDSASESEDSESNPKVPYRLARVANANNYSSKEIIQDAIPTKLQVTNLSKDTVDQRQSSLWNIHRKGCVTASNVHRVLNCKEKTSESVVNLIMQYNTNNISHLPSVKWGIDHKQIALKDFCSHMSQQHTNFVVSPTGLVVHEPFPFLAASPDGMLQCSCHNGKEVLEIK